MKYQFKKLTTILFLLILTNFSFGQSNEIKITFLGNAGFCMSDGTTHIYFDFPYESGAYGYMKYNDEEIKQIKDNSIFVFTHKHADHYSRKLVKKRTGKIYSGANRKKKISELNEIIPHFAIQSFKTKHRFSFNHYSYLIDWHGKRFFISGDTEHPETIVSIKAIDYAFIPPWISGYVEEIGKKIDAKIKVLYHIYPNQKIEGEIPTNYIVFDTLGKVINIPY